jgi:hypothetical protein
MSTIKIINGHKIEFSDREFTCYQESYEYELAQHYKRDNLELQLNLVTLFDMCYRKTLGYQISIIEDNKLVYKSIIDYNDRIFNQYDMIKQAMA